MLVLNKCRKVSSKSGERRLVERWQLFDVLVTATMIAEPGNTGTMYVGSKHLKEDSSKSGEAARDLTHGRITLHRLHPPHPHLMAESKHRYCHHVFYCQSLYFVMPPLASSQFDHSVERLPKARTAWWIRHGISVR